MKMPRQMSTVLTILVIGTTLPCSSIAATCGETLLQSAKHDPMPRLSNWLESKYVTLGNDYRKPDGRYSEHCGSLALDAAELLISYGKSPQIFYFAGKPIGGGNEPLVPLRFNGRVQWGGHQVAVAAGKAYDPMIGYPVQLSEYSQIVFGREISIDGTNDETWIKWALANCRKK